jgi:hypothetical protein
MRWTLILIIILLVVASLFSAFIYMKKYPQRKYLNWIQGKEWNHLYSIPDYSSKYLSPSSPLEIAPYHEDYAQLWKEFPLRNMLLPLPVRHPLFQTVPILDLNEKNRMPQVGMIFIAPNGRELSRIYTIPINDFPHYIMGQELFKLPYVRNRIINIPTSKLWRDIFSYKISVQKNMSYDQMIYNLYLLHIRSTFLPKQTVKYGLLSDGRALVELSSKDKDYSTELVMTQFGGSIYSYVLKTEIKNEDSQRLRAKFLHSIRPSFIDPALGKFLYKEFKQLNFARQVDQEGMLYLFSGWTQEFDNLEMYKEMIFFLERGRKSILQLKPLYSFGLKFFGKTFSTRNVHDDKEDPNVALQRKIELSEIEKSKKQDLQKQKPKIEKELTPDEKMNMYLKKTKEIKTENKDIIIH